MLWAMTTDEESIRNLIGMHAQLTDDGLAEDRVNLYVKDGVFIQGEQRSEGRDELTKTFSLGKDPARRGKHITSNMVIDIKGDRAEVRTDFAMVKPSPEGMNVLAIGRYYDILEKHDGEWLYRERKITFLTPS
jgi:hypothetical protein